MSLFHWRNSYGYTCKSIYNNLYHNEYFNIFSGQAIEKKGSHSNAWLIIKSEKLNGNKTHDATVHKHTIRQKYIVALK